MDWVLTGTGVIIFIGFIVGIYRGGVRIAVSLVTTAVTLILVTFATPYAAKAVSDFTPLDDMIQSHVEDKMLDMAAGEALTEGVLTKKGVRKVLKAAGVSEETLAEYGISIEDIVDGKVTGEELSKYGISRSLLDGLKAGGTAEKVLEEAEIPRDMQVAAIESAELPALFKNLLSENNNNEIYDELGVESFAQYVGHFLAKLIVNIVAFLCTFLLVTIVLRAIIFALDVVADLPVFGLFNRLAGGVAGVCCSLVVIWVIYILITLLYTTPVGKQMYEAIQANEILRLIYEYNPILKLAARI